MDRLKQDVVEKDRMLAEKSGLLSRQGTTILQLEQDLQNKSQELVQLRQINDETLQLRKQQAELRSELLQQQTDTASLQEKIDRMEHFMTQVSIIDYTLLGSQH